MKINEEVILEMCNSSSIKEKSFVIDLVDSDGNYLYPNDRQKIHFYYNVDKNKFLNSNAVVFPTWVKSNRSTIVKCIAVFVEGDLEPIAFVKINAAFGVGGLALGFDIQPQIAKDAVSFDETDEIQQVSVKDKILNFFSTEHNFIETDYYVTPDGEELPFKQANMEAIKQFIESLDEDL